jgi:hypothetical protein
MKNLKGNMKKDLNVKNESVKKNNVKKIVETESLATKITIGLVRRCRVHIDSTLCHFCFNKAMFETRDGLRMCSKCKRVFIKADHAFNYYGVTKTNIRINK